MAKGELVVNVGSNKEGLRGVCVSPYLLRLVDDVYYDPASGSCDDFIQICSQWFHKAANFRLKPGEQCRAVVTIRKVE